MHCHILCQIVVDQAFEGSACFGEKKAKLGRLSTFERSPQHQDHAKMNARILGNVMVVQRQNDQKVARCTRAKA
jgi:hypothetical protein